MSISNNPTITAILAKTIPYFAEKGIANPRLEADLLLAAVLDLPRVQLYAQWDRPLEPAEIARYRELVAKRVQGWPAAYLIGKKSFLNWDFIVTPAVLIPRPETEELVVAVVTALQGRTGLQGVEIGVGSGVIVISLAKAFPDSQWQAIDLDAEALAVAKLNAENLGVADRICFFQGDLFQPVLDSGRRFDLIISNPPYISSAELAGLQAEVRREPVMALDGGVDGLEFYRRMAPQMDRILAGDGLIALEHGYQQREPLERLFHVAGYCTESIPDLAGWDRILLARRMESEK
jgi:release factor glutamine methyltransferase